MSELHRPKIAVLASGGGTTAEAYAQSIHRGEVAHEIGLVIVNNPEAGILDRAKRWNAELGFDVETSVINRHTHPGGPNDRGQTYEEAEAITDLLDKNNIDLVTALGYMIIIKEPLIEAYCYVPKKHQSIFEARAINTHPGPLPLTQDTMGVGASETVIQEARRIALEKARYREAGKPEVPALTHSEHTMHVISEVIDDPMAVFARHPVEILSGDRPQALFQRVQLIEKATVAYAADNFLNRQGALHGDA
jgi:folate-dependent phosphoribosylglycinamide formyltransferase PurN